MNQKNGSLGVSILCSCAILSKYLVVLPEYMVKYVGNSAWIDVFAKCLLATLSLCLLLWLYKPFSPMSFENIFVLSFGKFGKIALGYIYAAAFTLFNAILLRLLSEALSTVMTIAAPDEYFEFFILIPVFLAAYNKIGSSLNLSCIIFPFVCISFLTVCLALFSNYRTENIMPIFGISLKRLSEGIFTKHFGFGETILLLFFAPMLGSFKEIKKTAAITFIIISFFSIVFTAAYCFTVPYPASKEFFLPFYQMTRMIKSGAFLQRLEPIVVFVWTSFVMCSMSVLISTASRLIATTGENEHAFVPIITIITFFISMLPSSENSAFLIYEKLLNYSTALFPIIPVIILIVARIRQRGQYLR